MREDGFCYIDELVPGIFWDAKYAGQDNFMGRPADGYFANRTVCTVEAASALKKAQEMAREKGLELFIFDAYRPVRAVKDFCRWAKDVTDTARKHIHYPNVDKKDLFPLGYIAERSGHSRGSTVDLTLCRPDGTLLDMGTIFDFMDDASHHGAEGISPAQTANRELLRGIMLSCGFTDYENEWWHYRLADEPHPDTYYDFVID